MCFRPTSATKRENKCPNCGEINSPTATVCEKCGAELPQRPPPPGVSSGSGLKPPPPHQPGGAPPPPKAPPAPPKVPPAPPKKD